MSEKRLGLELRRIREERELTVEGLAEKGGVSVTTIRGVERGAREARGDTVAKLARSLGLTFDEVWELQRRGRRWRDREGGGMTDRRNERDDERKRTEDDERRRDERGRRSDELKEAWRRNRPSEEEERKVRPRRSRGERPA